MYKKKSLGQHFLKSAYYVSVVADAANITQGETVVEIGPGEGVLTEALVARGAKVIAIEKDSRLIPVLTEKFAGKAVTIIEADALDVEVSKYIPKAKPYKVVGNVPYYITGALFKKFLTSKQQPTDLVFLVQKEVGERIARSKKESILSLSVKAYGTPLYIKSVPRGAFVPPPAVDSAVVAVRSISRKHFTTKAHEASFFELLHAGFGQKRKLLRRNIEKVVGKNTEALIEAAGVPANARAEDISLDKWLILSR